MYSNRRKLWRLFAVMATVTAMLVPAAVASAGGGGGLDDHECEEDHYQATNFQHVLYGRTQGTPVVDGKMQVNVSGLPYGVVIFWDQHFSTGSDGVVIIGTNFADVICGTWGTDEIWGRQGNDRIFGMGAGDGDDSDYDPAIAGSGDRLFGNKGNDFVTPGDGTGLGDMSGAYYTALIGGGQGNDTLYAGNGNDSLVRGGRGFDELFGGVSNSPDWQILRGGADADVLHANGGDYTTAEGSAGNDIVNGGWGDHQVLNGNNGEDVINGGSGDYQRSYGGAGNDELNAGTGDPQALFGGSGNDELNGDGYSYWGFGGSGNDTLYGSTDEDCLFGDLGANAGQVGDCGLTDYWDFGGFGQVFPVGGGVSGSDWIEGGEYYDYLFGGPGNDTIYGNTPKIGSPNNLMDVSDGHGDNSYGDDGDDLLLGSGGSCDGDYADGGANHIAGDTSRGYQVGDTDNVENIFDQNPGCVSA